MDEKIKTWPLRFPAKQNPNMEKALFDWLIVYSMTSKRSIDWFQDSSRAWRCFTRVRLTNQKPGASVSVR